MNRPGNRLSSLVFGPVPSRRLCRSIGINNIPPKTCTYSCVYCQVGRTTEMTVTRRGFFRPEDILEAAAGKLEEASGAGARVDYLTVVPDGEPTLDIDLDRLLKGLGELPPKSAVISNSSLIWDENVRSALARADWVSLKVDAATAETWKRIDRPHGKLDLEQILQGIADFSGEFAGTLVTETMLVSGINTSSRELEELAGTLERISPDIAYISAPTRPPAEAWVGPPTGEELARAYGILKEKVDRVEYLIDYEGEDFTSTEDPVSDLLGILAVHPMRESAVLRFLSGGGTDPVDKLEELLEKRLLEKVSHLDGTYLLRRFPGG